ncbi:hypothetical protein LX64_04913 [Chitinophaga skermanii]|uniref:Uncharacterized protein n=1 Tax=Chitinophaga skermanii TaxID=331697 RepID=A0A327Q1G5_9BACT|nr:hypothetical protein [Chitinophaga skermanii]RAI97863.1 hypothetical protein LX64_04913 [Chitinophaga skermanii]
MMKSLFMTILVTSTITISANAQSQQRSGLYLTVEDYVNARLSYKDAKINADVAFQPKAIKVNGADKVSLDKHQVYGFKDDKGTSYRFFKEGTYTIVDTTHFDLYKRTVNIENGKERTRETVYYFSTKPGDDVLLLTKENLKKAFPTDEKFHVMLDMQFKNDKALQQFDKADKVYKVKQLYAVARM